MADSAAITAGAILQKLHPGLVCPETASLTDAADVMTDGGRTSVLVQDEKGTTLGVITVNDLLAAFVEGVGWEANVAKWLRAGDARMPGNLLSVLSLKSSATLQEVAKHMASQKSSDHACHHVVIKDDAGDEIIGVLSALDVARALCGFVEANASDTVKQLLGDKTIDDVMKKREVLPTIAADASLAQAFRDMFASRQNCIVVVEEVGSDMPDARRNEGIITPRDVLRAFAEHMKGETTTMGWLRGLDASLEPRTISKTTALAEAADIMATNTLHHLVVVNPPSTDVEGIISALDIVCAIAQA